MNQTQPSDESLGGRVDLGTSSQVIILRARYRLNFRAISNCRELAIGSKSRKIIIVIILFKVGNLHS